ncbi:aspartate aminotransferase family protein [Salipaludibacillus sp. CF4.18]|uniref:aspartate aminotransferase family protein n=1 Tax=Salipaludibacillus sp. CF4.18 TaxID=3373081 RepID=UPI003EE49F5E
MAIDKVGHNALNYQSKTIISKRQMKDAENYLPGGVTANIKYFSPYPIVMKKGKGAWLTDVDGNSYVDYLMGYGSLALGHGHSRMNDAITEQLNQDGTHLFGTPHLKEVEFAKKIRQYYPSIKKLRYTNSGTEATQLAIRLAKVFTKKKKIAKFEGHYHGGFKEVLYSINPPLTEAGAIDRPIAVPESAGVEVDGLEPFILPFNDIEGVEKIISQSHQEIAAVLIEPVQAGFILAEQAFMDKLRELTLKYGIILIFDEIKTGFRIALGGAQELYRIDPDITTLGKIIGGGFPIGLVGGREDIMEVSSPKRGFDVFEAGVDGKESAKDVLFHSGTYNGHPTILAAGLATIQELEVSFPQIVNYTMELRKRIEEVGLKSGIPLRTYGAGTVFNVVWNEEKKLRHYRDLLQSNTLRRKELDFELLQLGVYTKPLNRYSISVAHGDKELDHTISAYENVCYSFKEGS